MKTKVTVIDRDALRDEDLEEAARILKTGGLVAFPTETVYGLGANALDEKAAAKIYAAKGRPSDNPLIAHIASPSDLKPLVKEIPEAAGKLMKAWWPGPLTMIFPKSSLVPGGTTGGLDTVAVRMPDDEVARRLIRLAGVPVAAPSANTSGRPSPTEADHVYQDMDGRIDLILDGGPVGIGVESTIVDVTGPVPILLRPGAVTLEMLEETVGAVEVDPAVTGPVSADVKPRAPGMKYRHYAPKAKLVLVEDEEWSRAHSRDYGRRRTAVSQAVTRTITRLAMEEAKKGRRVGIICTDETVEQYPKSLWVRSLGLRSREETIAHNLFGVLREFDSLEVEVIYSESFSRDHLGQAIMNRLSKAAGYHILKV
ncbi:MAG: threonylcarbamoyl-AMP synthase [Hungatella sp.]|nr:threonylcarbamoyl-AMP synthase [Hungatella sp.]